MAAGTSGPRDVGKLRKGGPRFFNVAVRQLRSTETGRNRCGVQGRMGDSRGVTRCPVILQTLLTEGKRWRGFSLCFQNAGECELCTGARRWGDLDILRQSPFQPTAPLAQMAAEFPEVDELTRHRQESRNITRLAQPCQRRMQVGRVHLESIEDLLSMGQMGGNPG